MRYTPPFKITPKIFEYSQGIARSLGLIIGQKLFDMPLTFRRTHNLKTIQASLAIEGNTLTLDQVKEVSDGKRVLGPSKDILEVKNALAVYDNLKKFNPLKKKDLLSAHHMLMTGLTDEHGKWRSGNVGVFKGKDVSHIAPPAKRVPDLMDDLFYFLVHNYDLSWLIKACIFHYELEFIHPFSDGNGRMGRLWQQLILMKEDKIFEFIPVEVIIKEHQQDYYRALGESDALGESTPFLEFSLHAIYLALHNYEKTTRPMASDAGSRLTSTKEKIGTTWFSRKDYINLHKEISTAIASRDVLFGLKQGIIEKQGEKNQTLYRFIS